MIDSFFPSQIVDYIDLNPLMVKVHEILSRRVEDGNIEKPLESIRREMLNG